MAGIDEVFERLVIDTDFRAALARDPHAALVEYGLTPAEVALLASRLDDGDQAQRAVEQRTSKSALLAALGMLGGGATDGVGADETLTVGGNRTEGPADEYTKVPAPPAPPAPIPYPNTAEADGAIESLELASEGIDVDDADAPAVSEPRKHGDVTLKRGLTDDSGGVHDDLAVSGDGVEVSGDGVEGPGDDLAVPDGDDGDEPSGQPGSGVPEPEPDALDQAEVQAGDGQADVVTEAAPGTRPSGPEPDDDVLEIADVDEAGGSGS